MKHAKPAFSMFNTSQGNFGRAVMHGLFASASIWALSTGMAAAQDAGAPIVLDPIILTASREGALDTMSRYVTVIERDEISRQQETVGSTAELLERMVPGMATASQTLTNYGQTLRGRNVQVIIDGVPMGTSRDVSRDLFNISPSDIESIEVVHGGSAIYGGGAAGGIIYINTLQASDKPLEFETTIGAATSLSNFGSDALSGRITQKVSGTRGNMDYVLSFSREQTRGFFDGDGDRIPPEPSQGDLSDTGTVDLMGKLGYNFGDQRLQFSVNYLDAEQDTDFISDPAVDALPPGDAKARALEGLELADQTSRENLVLNLSYSKEDLWGSKVDARLYYRDYSTRFAPFDGRPYGGWNALAQTFLESETYGGQVTFNTPLNGLAAHGANLIWGADIRNEKTSMPVTVFDGAAYDASGGRRFVVLDPERTFMPELTTKSAGIFGQMELFPTEKLTLRAGVRHDWATASYGDFTTLGQGDAIEGGEIDYSETTFNLGAVYAATQNVDLYASYSQAFELPDIGVQLRQAEEGFNVDDSNLAPRITDTYEIGMRGNWSKLSADIAAFYSKSDLGGVLVENFSLVQDRTKEKIYGIEGGLHYAVDDRLRLGGTFTLQEGTSEDPETGDSIALNSYRISPLKLTAYVEYSPKPWWDMRLQALYSAGRDSAFEDGVPFGGREVEDYAVLDLYNRFELERGTLSVGIENLLNNQYHTVFGQLLRNNANSSHVAAQGAMARVTYSVTW
ncbi:TonB-dependent receptor [Paracoccus alkanivorans]|uniref:TonB-dependent receptor n=1 Tax=Paracoccus alkanivorans TaxID=2116655 RepID=A0A3M0MK49_9RHOB|nr:TonB-dependent receptor [Paracoccus alkanivorans]RMC37938.1 TonB-dependent receptor [Paracoccus alkanivorans]